MIQLSRRLKMIADMVTPGSRVADIGCDHAHTSIYLVENHIASHVVAMDINKGPLQHARDNIALHGHEKDIEVRLSDGAMELKQGEVDTLLISGMGGLLIVKILKESEEVIKAAAELVIQPQSELAIVRRYLHEAGFIIVEEDMLEEDGKRYTAIHAQKGSETYDQDVFYEYGKLLLEKKHCILREYLYYGAKRNKDVIKKLKEQTYDRNEKRKSELEAENRLIETALAFYNREDIQNGTDKISD